MTLPQQVGARIPKQAASISLASLKRQEEVLPMAKLEQRRYNLTYGGLHIVQELFWACMAAILCRSSISLSAIKNSIP